LVSPPFSLAQRFVWTCFLNFVLFLSALHFSCSFKASSFFPFFFWLPFCLSRRESHFPSPHRFLRSSEFFFTSPHQVNVCRISSPSSTACKFGSFCGFLASFCGGGYPFPPSAEALLGLCHTRLTRVRYLLLLLVSLNLPWPVCKTFTHA